ncbi:hypothetical protein MRS44_001401 [Fusarium solani]|uniref:uncharacterized protein n=1 Tax=Fusarium solani TaxID=169388 RepID=UPI0032C43159|nr:hypothetical protein MRS44_001401 [Fusarium solani]
MCLKHVNVCCHCGELMEPHWVSCNFHLLLSRTALSQVPPLEEPLHSQCPYQKSDMHPTLQGNPLHSTITPIRKNFGEFLETALEDIPPPDPEDSSDDEISLTDDEEEEELLFETDFLGSLSGSMETSSAPPGLGVHFEINPELLTQGDIAAKEDSPDPESEPPSAENLAMEYRDLIAPIWAWFFPNDSGPDTEVSQ